MEDVQELSPKTYLKGLRKLFPDIEPYADDDWDWTWSDEGYQFLEACDFGMAELTFQRLIASRPDDADGFEGLAMVYKALGHKPQAVILIDEAIRLAKGKFAKGALDEEVLEEIAMNQRLIHEMEDEA
jgi:tetratricopeptide (TPR) repeat protein